MLIVEARKLQRLLNKRRALRASIRTIERDIRETKKMLRGLMREDHANPAWNETGAASKIMGDGDILTRGNR